MADLVTSGAREHFTKGALSTLFVGWAEQGAAPRVIDMNSALSTETRAGAPVELRNAVRFPLQIPLRLFTASGEIAAVTENISATGVAFTLPRPLEVQTQVRFTMKMPAEAMGTPTDVVVHCTGRVVRCNTSETCWRAAAVIDEYYFSQ